MADQEIGKITHYFGKISVAVIKLAGALKVGDTIKVKTHSGEFTQVVDSMQIEHASIQVAKKGDSIGMKVKDQTRQHDEVFVVTED